MMPPRGTVTECLGDLFQKYNKEEIEAFVASFCGVRNDAVENWWHNGTLPRGEQMLRLRVLLDLIGYQVEGFTELPDLTKEFARLIALDFISIDGARDALGYEKTDGVYTFVLKGTGLMPDRMYRFRNFVEQSQNDLAEMVKEFHERFGKLIPLNAEVAVRAASPEEPEPALVPPASVENRDTNVTTRPSLQLDEETLAHALVDTVRLMTSLAHAIDTSSNAEMTRRNVLFVLKRETVDDAIKLLEEIRNP